MNTEKELIENKKEAKKIDAMIMNELKDKSIGLLGFVIGIILLGFGIGMIFIGYWGPGVAIVLIGAILMYYSKK